MGGVDTNGIPMRCDAQEINLSWRHCADVPHARDCARAPWSGHPSIRGICKAARTRANMAWSQRPLDGTTRRRTQDFRCHRP